MQEGDRTPRPGADTPRVDIEAPELAEILAGQAAGLRDLTIGLEETLSASLCTCKPLSEDAFLTLQRIDYMRQALKDIEGLLLRFGPKLDWATGAAVTHDALRDSVDMRDSITPTRPPTGSTPEAPPQDATPGELDLW